MSDILNKYVNQKPDGAPPPEGAPFPLRQLLTFRWRTGNVIALPYAYLLWVSFNPSQDITLHFNTHTVKVKGTNLRSLFEDLLSFELAEVAEAATKSITEGDRPVVTEIFVQQLHEE